MCVCLCKLVCSLSLSVSLSLSLSFPPSHLPLSLSTASHTVPLEQCNPYSRISCSRFELLTTATFNKHRLSNPRPFKTKRKLKFPEPGRLVRRVSRFVVGLQRFIRFYTFGGSGLHSLRNPKVALPSQHNDATARAEAWQDIRRLQHG